MEGALHFFLWFSVAVLLIRLIAGFAKSVALRLLCSLVACLTYLFATIFAFIIFIDFSWLVGLLTFMCFILQALNLWSDYEEYVRKS